MMNRKVADIFIRIVKEAIDKINEELTKEGIVCLDATSVEFYNPNDGDVGMYETGKDYARFFGHGKMNVKRFARQVDSMFRRDYSFSNYTDKVAFDVFVKSGFKELQERLKNKFANYQKTLLENKVISLKRDIERSNAELAKVNAELTKYYDKGNKETGK